MNAGFRAVSLLYQIVSRTKAVFSLVVEERIDLHGLRLWLSMNFAAKSTVTLHIVSVDRNLHDTVL